MLDMRTPPCGVLVSVPSTCYNVERRALLKACSTVRNSQHPGSDIESVPEHTVKSSIELFLSTAVARAYPRVIGANREKSWASIETVLPLLAVAAYVLFYRAIDVPEEYIGLIAVGGAIQPTTSR